MTNIIIEDANHPTGFTGRSFSTKNKSSGRNGGKNKGQPPLHSSDNLVLTNLVIKLHNKTIKLGRIPCTRLLSEGTSEFGINPFYRIFNQKGNEGHQRFDP